MRKWHVAVSVKALLEVSAENTTSEYFFLQSWLVVSSFLNFLLFMYTTGEYTLSRGKKILRKKPSEKNPHISFVIIKKTKQYK